MEQTHNPNQPHTPPSSGMSLEVDFVKYARFLESGNLSEDQQREKLQEYWNIVCGFVSLGWGVSAPDHVIRLAEIPPEKAPKEAEKFTAPSPDVIELKDQKSQKPYTADAALSAAFGEGIET